MKKEREEKQEAEAEGEMELEERSVWSGQMCLKKRCIRHKDWAKTARDDVLFEIRDCGDQMRELDAEEKRIRERAVVRSRKEAVGVREV